MKLKQGFNSVALRVRMLHPLIEAQQPHVVNGMAACITADQLSGFDPQRGESFDEVNRLASEIIVTKDDASKSGRAVLRGIILHVLTARQFSGERDLTTIRKLILCGEWRLAASMRERGGTARSAESPYLLLWRSMQLNPACDGIVAGLGSQFRFMMKGSPKTFEDGLKILQTQMLSRSYGAAMRE